MKQPDFGTWFHQKTNKKIKYKIRFDANLLHDLAYLSSYIHDSEVVIEDIILKRKRLVISLDRVRWENFTPDAVETFSIDSQLIIYPVEEYILEVPSRYFEKGKFLSKVAISAMSFSSNYCLYNEQFEVILSSQLNFRIRIRTSDSEPNIILQDM